MFPGDDEKRDVIVVWVKEINFCNDTLTKTTHKPKLWFGLFLLGNLNKTNIEINFLQMFKFKRILQNESFATYVRIMKQEMEVL